MAKEYIKREALIEDFKHCGADKGLVDAIVYRINQHTTADVVEVRHGMWEDNCNGTFTCSVCGGQSSKMEYCGRCGARMDGKGENNG